MNVTASRAATTAVATLRPLAANATRAVHKLTVVAAKTTVPAKPATAPGVTTVEVVVRSRRALPEVVRIGSPAE